MSCYIVENEQINAMLTYASAYAPCLVTDSPKAIWLLESQETLNELGMMLLKESVTSFKTRYTSESAQEEGNTALETGFIFSRIETDRDGNILTDEDMIRMCSSYEYQSCEHDGWYTPTAKEIIDQIRQIATLNVIKHNENVEEFITRHVNKKSDCWGW